MTSFYVMPSLMICILLWTMLIHKQESAVIRFDQNRRMKDGIEYIMQKYLSPLRKLTAELPNHAIEMQIEIHDSLPTASTSTHLPQRRLIRFIKPHRPKLIKRSNDSDPTDETATTVAPDTEGSTANASPSASEDNGKMPVYMDDLKKAIEELEKKIMNIQDNGAETSTTSTSTTTTIKSRKQGDVGGCTGAQPQNLKGSSVQNIEDIVQLLKRAIQLDRRMPKPNDNLEWVQLKIPKKV